MKRFLGLGVLALSLAGVPTQQAAAECHFKLGFGFNFCFEYKGNHQWCRPGCFQHHGHQQDYIAIMPGHEHPMPQMQRFPPPPGPERRDPRGERKPEETSLQWGYPSLGYSYYHPVSYYPQQQQQHDVTPAAYYYPQQYYYPPTYSYPNYYQAPGMTFDR